MTFMIQDWLFKGLLVTLLLLVVFISSLLISRWLTRRGMERNKRWENLAAFVITIIVCAAYVGVQEQFVYWGYKGDLIVTADSEKKIEKDGVRIISTERPLLVYDIDTYGYLLRISPSKEGMFEKQIEVNVITTDYPKLYHVIMNSSNYIRPNGTVDFSKYMEEYVAPFLKTALEKGWEQEKNEEVAVRFAKAYLKEQFPYHNFEFQ